MSTANKILMGAAGGAVALPSDDQFNRVSFLSHFDGSNNGVNNVFIDGHDTSSPHTITANGNATQGSFGPFARPDGEWAVTFNGLDNNYLTTPNSSDFAFGTGDFTIELWFNANHTDTGYLLDSRGININGFYLSRQSGGDLVFLTSNGTGFTKTTLDVNTVNNTWYHFCATRASGVSKFFFNGSQVGSDVNDTSNINSTDLNIGAGYTNGLAFTGIISNLRIIKGTAVNPTGLPTSPATNVTNTVLLTCQSNRFVDNSSSGHTITPDGDVAVTAFGPFLTSSVYSAGTNGASSSPLNAVDYLSIADGSWKTLGTGDFTWEFWFYGETENSYMIGDGTAGQNATATFTLGVSGKRMILYYSDGTTAYSLLSPNSAPFYNLNEWHHVAYVRDGNDHKIYADGILRASETRSITMQDSTGAQHIGNFGPGLAAGADTIFSDVRLVKGTAVYSGSTYTVPTAPLTAISGTELLLNMADGQAIDSAAQNNLTLYGNANTSTDQAKFGDTSLHLDGTGDYVNVLPSGRGNIYNYTVEQWLYPTRNYSGSGHFDRIWSSGTALNNSVMLHLDNTTAPKIVLRFNDSIIWTSSVSISLNAWTHVAVSCDADGTRLYIAGTERGTSSTVAHLKNLAFNIGTSTTSAGFFQGYIDDFRTSDFARYTSNFTAPSEPFADKGQ